MALNIDAKFEVKLYGFNVILSGFSIYTLKINQAYH